MTTIAPALCRACKRLNGSVVNTCTAFPKGIPIEIALGGDHHQPVEGDKGKVFVPDSAKKQQLREWQRVFGK